MCDRGTTYQADNTYPEGLQTADLTCVPVQLVDTLPECVKVGGVIYRVIPSEEFTRGAESYASVSHRRLEIYIGLEPPNDPQQVRQSLLHELIHSAAQVYGAGTGEELSEAWVESLTRGLYQVLRDNPDATLFILEG